MNLRLVPKQALCPKSFLHSYRIKGQSVRSQVEECDSCHKKVGYNKVGDTFDNKKYLLDHFKDFVQPFGTHRKIFCLVYGDTAAERWNKAIDQNKNTRSTEEIWADAKSKLSPILRDETVFNLNFRDKLV